ncbi:alpha-(1,3)-fucosyltransferase 10 [Bicyclus anynana]|uniref:Fucosyltransferase n=1 Tax=Bicyclus anynana TaxID=110368 RepID=A0ABM3LN15_BICAN|nr:alpha-(1,3)-fucosyltransferase 10 [Bicyclus anynana]XP_023949080.2 alpha-(1,3)-fucosyltransferase 10 [Bicyclus anynana]XP_052740466.1 alpha-(1,3)-fucosyltransferase 10 [Bicyclus anynana]
MVKLKRILNYNMRLVNKVILYIYRRISRLTLNEVLFICAVFLIPFFIWFWSNREAKLSVNSSNPVIVWWTHGFPSTSETITCEDNLKCDVYSDNNLGNAYNVEAYLFYASNINFDDLPLPRKARDVIWGLYHEESPRNVRELLHEKTLSLFNFSATFSRYSDIPFPLQYLDSLSDITSKEYYIPTTEKNGLLKDISPVLYLQTDCETATERDAYVRELMKYINIDSYGDCLKNKELPQKFKDDYLNKLNDNEFLHYIARYKFVLALENGVCEDYVTEKFWRAIKVGSVPIYFGSPSIKDWFPNDKSAILIQDHPTPANMSEHIKKLLKNDHLYDEHLTHKTKESITNKRLIEEFRMRPYQTDALNVANKFECLVCRKIHEKKTRLQEHIVNKSHYDCPKPVSALTLTVNPSNDWVYLWHQAEKDAEEIFKRVYS